MSSGNGLENRFDEWKQKFDEMCNQGLEKIKADFPQKDPCRMALENAQGKLQDIEGRIGNYATHHKTQEYVYIQEYITDLYLELDKIEVDSFAGHQDLRKRLYQQLGQARGSIERKLHDNVDRCSECRNVRVLSK